MAAQRTSAFRPTVLAGLVLLLAVMVLPMALIVGVAALAGGIHQPPPAVGEVEGIPPRVLQAYQAAGAWVAGRDNHDEPGVALPGGGRAGVPGDAMATPQPRREPPPLGGCDGLDWTVLAAVGGVESKHGQAGGARTDPVTGEARPWIFGSALDGGPGRRGIPIGQYAGWWGLTGPSQQAVGPMQFLPATFEAHAVDFDGDGETNPHDIDDAAATAAAYICSAAGGEVRGLDHVGRLYNPGGGSAYVRRLRAERDRVQAALADSEGQAIGAPAGPVDLVNVQGIHVNAVIATQVDALLDRARRDGFELAQGSGGYRDPQRQIELRQANCGSSRYAIYEMPPSQCSPPTARPGTSMHEVGLAIDFQCNGKLIRSRSSPCFQWLDSHAATYGLSNLPSEPWHWSTDGS